MEAIVLCGLQGSGKSTLYRERWRLSHVLVSMDELGTRARDANTLRYLWIEAGFSAQNQ
jgi:predicted kinase